MDAKNRAIDLIVRYLFLFLLAIFLFYTNVLDIFFLHLTIYPVNFLISLFFNSVLEGNTLLFNSHVIELIPACIGVCAYFLFLMLNLSTPMSPFKRIKSLFFIFLTFWIINIIRIFSLAILFSRNFVYFDVIHKSIWYFFNIFIVVGIWFLAVYLFKIEQIPIYSDFKFLLDNLKNTKNYK